MIDRLLGGRYQIIEILGIGGFSQTYIAEDIQRPGKPKCVVKHLQPATSNYTFLQNARRLFQAEAETLEKLGHHDQIPRLLAYFEENQEFYLVQDFVPGHPLTDKLQPNQRWSESQVCLFLREILGILVFVHERGFIHRDIKPSNIIQREQDNKLVLVDFGSVKQPWTQIGLVATDTTELEVPATVGIGTPGYMAIEQARGRPRPNSDLYALGTIAIQALTGLHPVQLEEDAKTGEIIWQHHAEVSDALAAILTKMVRYHFTDRYETAAEALAEIEQLAIFYLPTQLISAANALPKYNGTANIAGEASTRAIASANQSNSSQAVATVASAANNTTVIYSAQANSPGTNNSSALQTTIFSPAKQGQLANSLKAKYAAISTPRQQYYLRFGATIAAAAISLVAGYAIYWQPQQIEKNFEQVENLKATGKSTECISIAAKISQSSYLYAQAQDILSQCKLAQAKKLAEAGEFKAAIAQVNSFPKNSPAYLEAQTLIKQWSQSILATASSKYQSGKLDEAIALAQNIPSTSPIYLQAQTTIEQWRKDWAKNNSSVQAAKSALNNGKWQEAIAQAKQVPMTPYWQEQIQPILQAASAKIPETRKSTTTLGKSSAYKQIIPVAKQVAIAPATRITPVTRRTTPTKRLVQTRRLPVRKAAKSLIATTRRATAQSNTQRTVKLKRVAPVTARRLRLDRRIVTRRSTAPKRLLRISKTTTRVQTRRIARMQRKVIKRTELLRKQTMTRRVQIRSNSRKHTYKWTTKTIR